MTETLDPFKMLATRGPLVLALTLTLALAGCMLDHDLITPQPGARADLSATPLPPEPDAAPGAFEAAGAAAATESAGSAGSSPASTNGLSADSAAPADTAGTYTFTLPPGIAQVRRTTDPFEQISLYQQQPAGRPAADAVPFLVFTLGPDAGRIRQTNPPLPATHTRQYAMHGMLIDEWTGYTQTHCPFAELLVRRPGARDELYAVAIAHDEAQRALAEQILASITWTPAQPHQAPRINPAKEPDTQ